jgi:hypothetical protein
MSSFPGADEVLEAYLDQVEALEHLLRGRAIVSADPNSRFHGLSDADVQDRLGQDRDELDRWAVLMLVASLEAALRTDALRRIEGRTKDDVRKPLRDLHKDHEGRVRLDDILGIWDAHVVVAPTVKQNLRTLLKHRHWLAHGRHWTNKHGPMPSALDAHAYVDDYVTVLRASVTDFPRQ